MGWWEFARPAAPRLPCAPADARRRRTRARKALLHAALSRRRHRIHRRDAMVPRRRALLAVHGQTQRPRAPAGLRAPHFGVELVDARRGRTRSLPFRVRRARRCSKRRFPEAVASLRYFAFRHAPARRFGGVDRPAGLHRRDRLRVPRARSPRRRRMVAARCRFRSTPSGWNAEWKRPTACASRPASSTSPVSCGSRSGRPSSGYRGSSSTSRADFIGASALRHAGDAKRRLRG